MSDEQRTMAALSERVGELEVELAHARAETLRQLKTVREHASGFACWFGMQEAHASLADQMAPDTAAIFHFMGSGASTMVTHGEVRRMLDTIYGKQGLAA